MDGITLFTIGATKVSLASALVVAGGALSAVSSISQGIGARRMAKHAATVDRQRAEREQQLAQLRADQIEEENKRKLGVIQARLSGTGRDISGGTELLVQEEFAEDSEFERQLALNQGDVNARRLRQNATSRIAEGKAKQTAGFARAATTLLASGGRAFA